MGRTKQKKKRRGGKLTIAVLLLCLAVFCVSAYMVVSQLVREKREAKAFEALIAQIESEEPEEPNNSSGAVEFQPETPPAGAAGDQTEPDTADPGEEPQSDPGFHKYDALHELNGDLFGWIAIEGTELNYPVMHTPDDPEYYLHRSFDGKRSASGVPFLDGACYPGCGNYIIYGHHMKNGTMFAVLPEYADQAFWREHPTIRFDTMDAAGEYEILAAFYSRVYRVGEENVFRYYDYTDLTDEKVFDEYIAGIQKAALYDTGVTARFGDRLITLITCNYHTKDGRFVVVAREKT